MLDQVRVVFAQHERDLPAALQDGGQRARREDVGMQHIGKTILGAQTHDRPIHRVKHHEVAQRSPQGRVGEAHHMHTVFD
jgi:hypothetical protein